MVAPLIIAAVAAAAVSAIAQWSSSEAARKASKAERERIDALYSKMVAPDFDPTQLSPKDYAVVKKYVPQAAQFIEEAAPEVVKQTRDMAIGRDTQLGALQRYKEIAANQGTDPQMQALLNEASRRGQIEAQSRSESALQDANRRGMLGSGAMLAAQLEGGSSAMDRAAQQGNSAAMEAYRQRIAALGNAAKLGGDIHGQDVDIQARNAAIINAFNQRNASRLQENVNSNTDLFNRAELYNIGQEQQAADRNVGNYNDYQQYNQNRADRNAQNKFSDEMSILGGKAGQSNQNIQMIQQNAQDRNNAIQGVTNVGMGAFDRQAAADAEKERQNRADARNRYMADAINPPSRKPEPAGHTWAGPDYNEDEEYYSA